MRAKETADDIIRDAKNKAQRILAEAYREADYIKNKAQRLW